MVRRNLEEDVWGRHVAPDFRLLPTPKRPHLEPTVTARGPSSSHPTLRCSLLCPELCRPPKANCFSSIYFVHYEPICHTFDSHQESCGSSKTGRSQGQRRETCIDGFMSGEWVRAYMRCRLIFTLRSSWAGTAHAGTRLQEARDGSGGHGRCCTADGMSHRPVRSNAFFSRAYIPSSTQIWNAQGEKRLPTRGKGAV